MNLMIVPGMFVCSSFLICVCMFIVSKALLISSATVIVRAGGAIWLNPFATVLFRCSNNTSSMTAAFLQGSHRSGRKIISQCQGKVSEF